MLAVRKERAHIEFISFNILQVQSHRVFSGVSLVYIADTVGGQVDLSILLIGQLVLSAVVRMPG
jgi:hypothetical protein